MAFRAPAQAPRRQTPYTANRPPALEVPFPSEFIGDDYSQWVLFSPSQSTSPDLGYASSTVRTRTAGRLSDFGSFGTTTQSTGQEDDIDELTGPLDEDGTELDSLDDDLHAFRAPPVTHEWPQRWDHGATMLPAHDGLGSFHASSQLAQNQLWQHELYNPRRRLDIRPRRRSSVQRHLDANEAEEVVDPERERWQRIEKWRREQSRAVLEEIEAQMRRQRNSHASELSERASTNVVPETLQSVSETPSRTPSSSEGDAEEPLWRRITLKLMRDVIGIDDSMLSILFGESLPFTDTENQTHGREPSEIGELFDLNEAIQELGSDYGGDNDQWQTRLIQRIARELGILVHQLCKHPGAFSTYRYITNSIPNEYAGIPLGSLPEEDSPRQPEPVGSNNNPSPTMSPLFIPTLHDPSAREHVAQWGIEEDEYSNRAGDHDNDLSEPARSQQERDYWERDLDIMLVFRYLWARFGRRGSTKDHSPPTGRHIDPVRRAAIIRQHHPLVARAQSCSRPEAHRHSQQSGHSGPTGISSPLLRQQFRRPSSSCASQSAKMSAALSSKRTLTGSSRNYWDIGGSVESGGSVAVGGVWGDA